MIALLNLVDPVPEPGDVDAGLGSAAIVLLLPVVLAALWLVALVDALRRPESQWSAAQQNRLLYVLLMVFLSLVGAALYWFIARPKLRSVS